MGCNQPNIIISGEQDNESVRKDVVKGRYQIVHFTPEMILSNRRWREMLIGDVYTLKEWYIIVCIAYNVINSLIFVYYIYCSI